MGWVAMGAAAVEGRVALHAKEIASIFSTHYLTCSSLWQTTSQPAACPL